MINFEASEIHGCFLILTRAAAAFVFSGWGHETFPQTRLIYRRDFKYESWVCLCLPLRWYHGHLSGSNAEKLLTARDEPGTFLVRESLSKPGDFVLSVLTDEVTKNGSKRVSHIKIMCQVCVFFFLSCD